MLVGASTDVGKIREINQDAYYCSDVEEFPLFIIADGMGGHNAGEVASAIAVDSVKQIFNSKKNIFKNGETEVSKFIKLALIEANTKIYNKAKEIEDCKGMGTTITLAYILDNHIHIGHIGDSRAYLLTDGELIQLTQDHSLVAELVRNGSISEEEAENHPQKNIITRALGTDENIEVDIITREVKENDKILLCTDGLTNMVCDEKIKEVLVNTDDLQNASDTLVNIANESGGYDNTTVILIGID
ncbi:Stp1/IreP family PP2C-type Ser/Thr phosphatase [Caldisalinibacter kiritimatiensis]|uniref:protein-serine/threonine phosphatase n=1 Tax=Caldisalinibacter kiritimatiensis TaxID=1304284 RepID=R1CXH2_9FIRM|nr:Stp1/IreP family PP2C-type Ser/Thr phosphatase [Caldisalinibacter kiritimatiensis]EOD01319.1 Protein serine/threonine phosphatase PrpC, regulation of stationary phase [Caldisalinibacter kiritimatiensis]